MNTMIIMKDEKLKLERERSYIECRIKNVIEHKFKFTREDIKKNVNSKFLKENGLEDILKEFGNSPYKVIDFVYPKEFQVWEIGKVPKGFWSRKENRVKAIRWLIEDKLKMDEETLKKELSQELFASNSLKGLLVHYFEGSPYKAINFCYPDKYKPWEFKKAPVGFWKNDENKRVALNWLIKEKLCISKVDLKDKLSVSMFRENGLGSLLDEFNSSPYKVIDFMYPGEFKPWEFASVPRGFWDSESNKKEAILWLLEKKGKGHVNKSKKGHCINTDDFEKSGLNYLISNKFGNNVQKALEFACA